MPAPSSRRAAAASAVDLRRLQLASIASRMAYLRPDVIRSQVRSGKRPETTFHADACTGADAYSWVEAYRRTLVVSFRGTHDLRDLLASADLRLVSSGGAGRVHQGFLAQYASIEVSVMDAVDRAVGHGGVDRLECVGHSLGGALATLCATQGGAKLEGLIPVSLITFGCPRVGDGDFASAPHDQLEEHFRVLHESDPVPQMPAPTNYRHLRGRRLVLSSRAQDPLKEQEHPRYDLRHHSCDAYAEDLRRLAAARPE